MNKRNILLLLFIAMATAMNAATTTYERYSQWMTHSEMKRVGHPYDLVKSGSNPKWTYEVGIELEGMLDCYLTYGDEDIMTYLKEYPQKMIDSSGKIVYSYKQSDYNLDNVRPGRFIFRMYKLNGGNKDSLACQTLMAQLDKQPRTQAGPWHHKAIYANQVWLDGIYMGLPFYTLSAPSLRKGKEANIYADAIMQMTETDRRTYDAATDLWKHAWDETHSIFWADKTTGQSQHTWGRALGWFAMAFVEVLDVMPEDTPDRDKLIASFRHVMASIVKYQDAGTGVWYDVLDVNDPKNYFEATCSSMFTYALLKGVRKGWLGDNNKDIADYGISERQYLEAGVKAYKGLIKQFIKQETDGRISLTKCVSVSGLGPESNPKRDGSFEYYMSESLRDNDAKGVGPFIWASIEAETLGMNVSNVASFELEVDGISTPTVPKASSRIFNLRGQELHTLQHGINIVNGHAVIVK